MGESDTRAPQATMKIEATLRLAIGDLFLARLNHSGPDEHHFVREDVYWIDHCLSPRRRGARARYVDRWGAHRFAAMGSIMALPPRFNLHLKSEGGRHLSLICAIRADAIEGRFPDDFEWTDRRLEACLDISSPTIREIMLRLTMEMRRPGIASADLCEALILELSVELVRYLVAIAEPVERGGLATWRLRTIDERLAQDGEMPTLKELAELCRMSVRQLSRGFRTSHGSSLGEYMAQGRIETAKRKLAGADSIKAIASAVGFSGQSTFTYSFRRATGFTPLQFRRRILERIDRDSEHS